VCANIWYLQVSGLHRIPQELPHHCGRHDGPMRLQHIRHVVEPITNCVLAHTYTHTHIHTQQQQRLVKGGLGWLDTALG
jgi:hypothetical protein